MRGDSGYIQRPRKAGRMGFGKPLVEWVRGGGKIGGRSEEKINLEEGGDGTFELSAWTNAFSKL